MPSITSLISQRIKPSCAVWEITLKCNSNCIHCGSKAGKARPDELNTEESLKLVKEIRECGYKGVALMGGEPLIRDDWYEIAREIKKNKLELNRVKKMEVKSDIPARFTTTRIAKTVAKTFNYAVAFDKKT